MVLINKKRGESTDVLLRRFTKMTKEENIAFDVSRKKFFLKPALLKKEKKRDKLKRRAQERRRLSR